MAVNRRHKATGRSDIYHISSERCGLCAATSRRDTTGVFRSVLKKIEEQLTM